MKENVPLLSDFINVDIPIIVSYGMGVDSTAMLVAMKTAGIIPAAILFADVGNEHPETYQYRPIIDAWLLKVGFPSITVVRYRPMRFKHGRYSTLYGNCIRNKTLPGISFGRKSCSMKWKGQPMDKWVKQNFPNQETQRLIGYDASAKDRKRCGGVLETEHSNFKWLYPLAFLNWNREQCIEAIAAEGLPVPRKSACFFCGASSMNEVQKLAAEYPNLAKLAIAMEDNALPNLTVIKGLWGREVKGTRNPAAKRPGNWREFIHNSSATVVFSQNLPSQLNGNEIGSINI